MDALYEHGVLHRQAAERSRGGGGGASGEQTPRLVAFDTRCGVLFSSFPVFTLAVVNTMCFSVTISVNGMHSCPATSRVSRIPDSLFVSNTLQRGLGTNAALFL